MLAKRRQGVDDHIDSERLQWERYRDSPADGVAVTTWLTEEPVSGHDPSEKSPPEIGVPAALVGNTLEAFLTSLSSEDPMMQDVDARTNSLSQPANQPISEALPRPPTTLGMRPTPAQVPKGRSPTSPGPAVESETEGHDDSPPKAPLTSRTPAQMETILGTDVSRSRESSQLQASSGDQADNKTSLTSKGEVDLKLPETDHGVQVIATAASPPPPPARDRARTGKPSADSTRSRALGFQKNRDQDRALMVCVCVCARARLMCVRHVSNMCCVGCLFALGSHAVQKIHSRPGAHSPCHCLKCFKVSMINMHAPCSYVTLHATPLRRSQIRVLKNEKNKTRSRINRIN